MPSPYNQSQEKDIQASLFHNEFKNMPIKKKIEFIYDKIENKCDFDIELFTSQMDCSGQQPISSDKFRKMKTKMKKNIIGQLLLNDKIVQPN